MKALDPYLKKAIAEGRPIVFTTPAGARFFLKNVRTEELLKMERNRGVCLELLFRRGIRDEYRKEALSNLAKLEHKGEVAMLLDAIQSQESVVGSPESGDESVVFDLVRLLTSHSAAELAWPPG